MFFRLSFQILNDIFRDHFCLHFCLTFILHAELILLSPCYRSSYQWSSKRTTSLIRWIFPSVLAAHLQPYRHPQKIVYAIQKYLHVTYYYHQTPLLIFQYISLEIFLISQRSLVTWTVWNLSSNVTFSWCLLEVSSSTLLRSLLSSVMTVIHFDAVENVAIKTFNTKNFAVERASVSFTLKILENNVVIIP